MIIIAGTDHITSITFKERKKRQLRGETRARKCLKITNERQNIIDRELLGISIVKAIVEKIW
jgi:hypothetical protein